jgi:hypothetical protein
MVVALKLAKGGYCVRGPRGVFEVFYVVCTTSTGATWVETDVNDSYKCFTHEYAKIFGFEARLGVVGSLLSR